MKKRSNEIPASEFGIDRFVRKKLQRFTEMGHDFASLFELMFAEGDNVLYEWSSGLSGESITYKEAKRCAQRRAASLKEELNDLPEDAVVGLYMENGPEWIETFWAILLAGFRPLLLNARLDEKSLQEALKYAEAQAVISDGKTFRIRTIAAETLLKKEVPLEVLSFGSEILLMSSGTSLHVKICAYTGEEIYYQVRDSYRIIRDCKKIKGFYNGRLKLLDLLPFYHVFGLMAMYIWFAFFSRTFVHLPDLSPQTIRRTILKHEVTHVFAVPLFWDRVYEQALKKIRDRGDAVYERFARALAISGKLGAVPLLGAAFRHFAFREVRENLFGESIRFMISGGSTIRPEVLRFFNGIGYRLANGYGMSEIGICSVELSGSPRYLYKGCVGKPLSSLAYRINEDGELLVRGRSLSNYVLEAGFKRTNPDWFNTHDLAVCDRGHYLILGRKDDLVIGADGENLNPNLVEDRLKTEGIRELCLVDASQATLLCSVKRGLSEEEFSDLAKRLKERIADENINGIGRIVFTTDPLLAEGEFKCNRRKIRDTFLMQGYHTISSGGMKGSGVDREDPLYQEIAHIFASSLEKKEDEIEGGMNFFLDLSGTSLDYFALLSALREKYAIDFPPDAGIRLASPDALYEYIKEETHHVD